MYHYHYGCIATKNISNSSIITSLKVGIFESCPVLNFESNREITHSYDGVKLCHREDVRYDFYSSLACRVSKAQL